MKKRIALSFLLILLLAGCSAAAAQPKQIAAELKPVAVYPTQALSPADRVDIYAMTLELEVADPQLAASDAAGIGSAYGATLVTRQEWFEDGRSVVFMEFSLPDWNSAQFHNELLRLGRLTGENYTTYSHTCLYCQPFALVSLYLRSPRQFITHPLPGGWDPLRTLQAALGVSVRILGTVADILIWLAVVGGPIAFIVWAAVWLIRRLRREPPAKPPAVPPPPPQG